MANCERCRKKFEKPSGVPKFVVCEIEVSGICCSGYGVYEIELCPECLKELEGWMMRNLGGTTNGVLE